MKWVFLPGLDGSGDFFEPFLRVLPESIEPMTVGFPPNQKLGYDELFQWLLPKLPREEPFLMVAESFSGPLAVRLAAARPKGWPAPSSALRLCVIRCRGGCGICRSSGFFASGFPERSFGTSWPIIGVIAMTLSSLSVMVNSLLLKLTKTTD